MIQLTPHLIPQCICYIQQLETVDQYHGEGGGTSELHLFHQHAKVYDHLREKQMTWVLINMTHQCHLYKLKKNHVYITALKLLYIIFKCRRLISY